MVPLFVVCNGIIRSGSTWSYNVCRALAALQARRLGQKASSAYQGGDELEQTLLTMAKNATGPVVIKAHQLGRNALRWIRTGRLKAICTIRDPRDCIASDMAFMGHGVEAAVARVSGDLGALPESVDFGRTLFIRYEEMMKNRPQQIRLIAAHLNVELIPAEIKVIDQQTDPASSRLICDQLKQLPLCKVLVRDHHRVDPVTQLHENHLGSGRIGRWRDELPLEIGRWLAVHLRASLLRFGYETEESLATMLGPGQGLSDSSLAGIPGVMSV